MDNVSEERLNQVHPHLATAIRFTAKQLAEQGIIVRVVQGLRTVEQQDAMYHQVPKVTNARGGYSWHNFGLAVDLVPGIRGKESWTPNWNAQHPDYKAMIEMGESYGLVSGSRWIHMPDAPHFQLAALPTSPDDDARALLSQRGMGGLWNALLGTEAA